MEEISEAQDQMQQMNEVLAQPIGTAADLDEDELAAELAVSWSLTLNLLDCCTPVAAQVCQHSYEVSRQHSTDGYTISVGSLINIGVCFFSSSMHSTYNSEQLCDSLDPGFAGNGGRGAGQPIAGACPSANNKGSSQGAACSSCRREDACCTCTPCCQAKAEDPRGVGARGLRSRDGCMSTWLHMLYSILDSCVCPLYLVRGCNPMRYYLHFVLLLTMRAIESIVQLLHDAYDGPLQMYTRYFCVIPYAILIDRASYQCQSPMHAMACTDLSSPRFLSIASHGWHTCNASTSYENSQGLRSASEIVVAKQLQKCLQQSRSTST